MRWAWVTVVLFAVGLGAAAPPAAAGPLAPITGVEQVATGAAHSCALLTNGRVRCWGDNTHGQLGTDDPSPPNAAPFVENVAGTGPLRHVVQVTAGGNHTCALLDTGEVRCWGEGNDGELGEDGTSDRFRPVVVIADTGAGPITRVMAVTALQDSTCLLMRSTQVRCFGDDGSGQLGNGPSTIDVGHPERVRDLDGQGPLVRMSQIDGGDARVCGRYIHQSALCWGQGIFNGNGNHSNADAPLPVFVGNVAGTGPLARVAQVSVGAVSSCAALTLGEVRCWGYDADGELGDGPTDSTGGTVAVVNPAGTAHLTGITRTAVGQLHACAVNRSGQVRCWGDDVHDELGDGTGGGIADRPVAVVAVNPPGRLGGVTSLATFGQHTCVRVVVNHVGQARCWGRGGQGRLGDGGSSDQPRPVIVGS